MPLRCRDVQTQIGAEVNIPELNAMLHTVGPLLLAESQERDFPLMVQFPSRWAVNIWYEFNVLASPVLPDFVA